MGDVAEVLGGVGFATGEVRLGAGVHGVCQEGFLPDTRSQ